MPLDVQRTPAKDGRLGSCTTYPSENERPVQHLSRRVETRLGTSRSVSGGALESELEVWPSRSGLRGPPRQSASLFLLRYLFIGFSMPPFPSALSSTGHCAPHCLTLVEQPEETRLTAKEQYRELMPSWCRMLNLLDLSLTATSSTVAFGSIRGEQETQLYLVLGALGAANSRQVTSHVLCSLSVWAKVFVRLSPRLFGFVVTASTLVGECSGPQ